MYLQLNFESMYSGLLLYTHALVVMEHYLVAHEELADWAKNEIHGVPLWSRCSRSCINRTDHYVNSV